MNIAQRCRNISMSSIDRSIEAFITPPNDPLVGVMMDHLPKDRIEIRGSLGDREFSYTYTLDKNLISMKGTFDNLPFEYQGTFSNDVSLTGRLGDNELSGAIRPEVQGPRTTTKAGLIEGMEKWDIDLTTGAVSINGDLGGDRLQETIMLSSDGKKILDNGSLGSQIISREVTGIEGGYCIRGTIGGFPFEEYITVPKK